LTKVSRKWLLKSSPRSLRDKLLFQFHEWHWVAYYDEFVRTGEPLNLHQSLSEQQWELYRRGLRSLAGVAAPEVAARTPIPAGARHLLDIGGSHGYYSVAFCRRHPALSAVVLDLPRPFSTGRKSSPPREWATG
jgi:hypothetical protein